MIGRVTISYLDMLVTQLRYVYRGGVPIVPEPSEICCPFSVLLVGEPNQEKLIRRRNLTMDSCEQQRSEK
jgi:hypothetical protein